MEITSSAVDKTVTHFLRVTNLLPYEIQNGIDQDALLRFLNAKHQQMHDGKVLPATIYGHLSNLTRFHFENGLDWSPTRNDPQVISFLRYKINTFRPTTARKPRCPPVTLRDLETFALRYNRTITTTSSLAPVRLFCFGGLGACLKFCTL